MRWHAALMPSRDAARSVGVSAGSGVLVLFLAACGAAPRHPAATRPTTPGSPARSPDATSAVAVAEQGLALADRELPLAVVRGDLPVPAAVANADTPLPPAQSAAWRALAPRITASTELAQTQAYYRPQLQRLFTAPAVQDELGNIQDELNDPGVLTVVPASVSTRFEDITTAPSQGGGVVVSARVQGTDVLVDLTSDPATATVGTSTLAISVSLVVVDGRWKIDSYGPG